jgi:phosphoglycolate phosphatase-like HAD superfamily hydrolase
MNKLLLFDIDGTLISGRGVPKQVFLDVVRRRFPHFNNGESLSFAGMTDPLIIRRLLEMNDLDAGQQATLIREILEDCMNELALRVNRQHPPIVLPGVHALLERCAAMPDCYLGLVTGNMAAGAQIKLLAAGLYGYFSVGAFGSDHWDRNELPPRAIARSQACFNRVFDPVNIWIIGDSIYDVRCAKANGLKCLAVGTSITSPAELHAENPELFLSNLENTAAVCRHLGL